MTEGAIICMAEHKAKGKNGIIYIIPNDELYEKWKKDEAFIDDYGRLMNRRPHRVLKELKACGTVPHTVQRKTVTPPVAPASKEPSFTDQIKDSVRENLADAAGRAVEYGLNELIYEVLPYAWNNGIVPLYHLAKDALTSKETKAETLLRQEEKRTEIVEAKTPVHTKMTPEEANAEKRKVLYHWLALLSSLKKLNDAGEMDVNLTLAQLTDPAILERVNRLLSENPNLLETDKYIELSGLLGRNLYKEKQLIPIEVSEIESIAESVGHEAETDDMEDNNDGR
jgi:hypothetical protein